LIDQYAHIKAFVIQFLLQLQTQSWTINNIFGIDDGMSRKYKFQKTFFPFMKAYVLLLIHNLNEKKAKDILD
jgi:hypothetical protein